MGDWRRKSQQLQLRHDVKLNLQQLFYSCNFLLKSLLLLISLSTFKFFFQRRQNFFIFVFIVTHFAIFSFGRKLYLLLAIVDSQYSLVSNQLLFSETQQSCTTKRYCNVTLSALSRVSVRILFVYGRVLTINFHSAKYRFYLQHQRIKPTSNNFINLFFSLQVLHEKSEKSL